MDCCALYCVSARLAGMQLGELTTGRNNNLNALRLIAALMVILSHSYSAVNLTEPFAPFYKLRAIGTLGLYVFFIISGFLITQSFLRQSPVKFLQARVLRIFPALLLVVVASVFVIGPLVTKLPINEYFHTGETYHYLQNVTLTSHVLNLPGVFDDRSINGSLWTIRYEFLYYLLVMLVGIIGILKDRRIVLGLFILFVVLNYFDFTNDINNVSSWSNSRFIWLFSYFSAGVVAYLYREYITLSLKIFSFVVSLLVIASFKGGLNDSMMVFLFAYVVLFLGYYPKLNLSWLTKFGDFSYGIYLWGTIIIRLFVYFFGTTIYPLLLFFGAGCFTYIAGALSWLLIEKRALALKTKTIKFPSFRTAKPA